MKRLVILALLAFAGWYGWHHRDALDDLLHKRPQNQAVVQNHAGETVTRIRLSVGGRTFVKEELPNGESATFPFAVNSDSKFTIAWEYAGRTNEGHWTGGEVAPGPMVSRYVISIVGDEGVIYETQPLGAPAP